MLHQNKRVTTLLAALGAAPFAVFSAIALASPVNGLDYEDAAGAAWLKMVPFCCTLAWLYVTYRLLRKSGASIAAAGAICALAGTSSTVIFLGAHHTRQPLFALLAAASLLALLSMRPVLAGVLGAMACVVQPAGLALAIAGILVLVSRRRLRAAALFAAASMLLAGPVVGWKLAHGGSRGNILTHLEATDKIQVLTANLANIMQAPAALTAGTRSLYGATVFAVLLLWSWWKRRQMLPDLFVVLYTLLLATRIFPPERYVAPVLPLLLWMIWRGFTALRPEIAAAAVLLLFGLELHADFRHLPDPEPIAEWPALQTMFGYIRDHAPPGEAVVANLDRAFSYNTGRRALPGYRRDSFRIFYQPRLPAVTPDALEAGLRDSGARLLALTPDKGRGESRSFHQAVEALERGGVLQPVEAPQLPPDYRLLKYVPIIRTVPARNR